MVMVSWGGWGHVPPPNRMDSSAYKEMAWHFDCTFH